MQAILLKDFGTAEQLYIGEYAKPVPKENEVLIEVRATALNRADILQREGKYPPPEGESEILGLEAAGEIIACGKSVTDFKIGEAVCCLLPGGGYAQYVTARQEMLMPIPKGLSYIEAAAIPEVFMTAYQALLWLGKVSPKEKVLIHAAASGVGTAAIQLAVALGAQVVGTASAAKHDLCYELGAEQMINYKKEKFVHTLKNRIDVILDFVAAPYFNDNIDCLKLDGRLILIALLGGAKVSDMNLAKIIGKRLHIKGTTLRSRSHAYQNQLCKAFANFAIPLFEQKKIKPIIDSVYDWKDIAAAHTHMECNKNSGKIVVKIK
ncbi:MAG: NAD(P)H-quinone oxidoreductase [Bernardetiaceae bacterium]|nr:NAD(P)H-quinone oxidoreductase [Bernardetiaceae bacterium]